MVVIVRIATIFPGRQSRGWGIYGTRSHWRGVRREKIGGEKVEQVGEEMPLRWPLKKGYEEGAERDR
jgi:hypothetical protein